MKATRRAVAIVLFIAIVACGREAEPVGPASSEALDRALSERSLLSLGGDEIGSSGRFTISEWSGSSFFSQHTIPPLSGRYWTTEAGNVYTDFDVDAELIGSEMTRLLPSGVSSDGSLSAEWLENHYRGSEFQVGFADLLSWVGVAPPIWWTRLFNAIHGASAAEVDDPETLEPLLRPGCLSAHEKFEVALAQWTLDLEPRFELSADGIERWDLPLHDLETIPEFQSVMSTCTDPHPSNPSPPIRTDVRITRERDEAATKLVVFGQNDLVSEFQPVLEIVMSPDDGIGEPPETPDPYGLLTTMGSYLATISHCSGLPYIRTEIFVTDYTGPDEPLYFGPSIFASGWACGEILPDDSDRIYLPALLADPVSELELPGASLEWAMEQAEDESGFMDMPDHASVSRLYQVEMGGNGGAIFEEAIAAARTFGWVFEPEASEAGFDGSGPIHISGYKDLEPGPAELFLSFDEEENKVYLNLEFGSSAPWTRGKSLSVGSTITLEDLAGRGGNYVTFHAKSGDVLTLDVDMTSSRSYLSVLVVSPSGIPLWSSHEADDPVDASSVTFGPTEVDETGTYIVVLDPPDSGTHTVQLGLTSEEVRTMSTLLLEASMPIDSSLRLIPSPGENVRVTFEGTVGQSLSIQAASTLEPDEIAVRVTAPGGEQIWETTSFSARRDGGSWVFLDRVELFETGLYSINLDVGEGESREIDIELFDVTTPLPDSLDGVEIPLRLEGEISQPGQNLISAFQGSPGSLIGFELVTTGLRTFDGSPSGIEVQITAPSGELLWSGELSGNLESTPFVLNEAGNHIVVLDPVGPSVGTIEFSVEYCQPRQVLIDSDGNWEPCNPPNT